MNAALNKVSEQIHQATPVIKHVVDGAAISVAVGAFFDWLPGVAALLSIIWLSIQIFSWIENRIKNKDKK